MTDPAPATATRKKKAAPGMVPAVIALVVVVLLIIGVGGYMMWGGSDCEHCRDRRFGRRRRVRPGRHSRRGRRFG